MALLLSPVHYKRAENTASTSALVCAGILQATEHEYNVHVFKLKKKCTRGRIYINNFDLDIFKKQNF